MQEIKTWCWTLPLKLIDRQELIISLCKDKSVLHLGCADYPATQEQIDKKRFLHTKIMSVARNVTGIDNNRSGIELLCKAGINNIVEADAENLHKLDIGTFEVVIAGEIIEHLKNPGFFLEGVKKFMNSESLLVISVPNAFCLRRFLWIPLRKEKVHPDHCYYFSHATLSHLLESCGYLLVKQSSYCFKDKNFPLAGTIEKIASLLSPNLCEGLFYIAKKSDDKKR